MDHHLRASLTNTGKEDLEVRAPLVVGEDAGVTGDRTPSPFPPTIITPTSVSPNINHRGQQQPPTIIAPPTASPRVTSTQQQAGPSDDRMRAAASVFAWLRRPNIFQPQQELTSQARLARSIDHVSKTVFPFLFGVFSFTFFAVFAGYLPSLLDEWIANEYRDE